MSQEVSGHEKIFPFVASNLLLLRIATARHDFSKNLCTSLHVLGVSQGLQAPVYTFSGAHLMIFDDFIKVYKFGLNWRSNTLSSTVIVLRLEKIVQSPLSAALLCCGLL